MNKEIIIAMRSITYATKSKRVLIANGIRSRIVKPDIRYPTQGCGYGIAIAAEYESMVLDILYRNRISYTEIFR